MRLTEEGRDRRAEESGFALVIVVTTLFLISALLLTILGMALQSFKNSDFDSDWGAALNAANAGVDEYISHLNDDGNYWQYGNSSAPFTADSGSSVTSPPSDRPNAAFTGWVNLPGASGRAQFRYEVDNSEYLTTGAVRLRSSGQVGDAVRSVETLIRRRSFIDFLYFTDFETQDPALYTGNPFTSAQAQSRCAKYYYSGRSPECIDINFGGRDVINGPLHTNDAFLVLVQSRSGSPSYGPVFNGDTSTSYRPASTQGPCPTSGSNPKRYRCNPSGTNSRSPYFARAADPRFVSPLTIPPSNTTLRREVMKKPPDSAQYSQNPGCMYSGPTKLTLLANGKMRVDSPYTQWTSTCGGGQSATLSATSEYDLPPNGVVYVQNRPSPVDVYTRTTASHSCSRTNCIGYPINSDRTLYQSTMGDVFIQGTLNGQLTVAAQNDVVITGDLTYSSGLGGDDLLGLVANNYVNVYHPVQCAVGSYASNCNLAGPAWGLGNEPDIHAAILSVAHSFRVQNYNVGAPLGNLRVSGAIAQKYRGIVGLVGQSGYDKVYNYDSRLKYQSPPKFLDPVQSAFGVSLWSEIDRAY